jgi:hypothetical protein
VATTGLLYQPQMIDDCDCGAIGGMKIGKGNWSTRRKPAPVPLCPPQIPHDRTQARTRAATVGSRWINAWAMARPYHSHWLVVLMIYLVKSTNYGTPHYTTFSNHLLHLPSQAKIFS